MPKTDRSTWTADEREFDRLASLMESRNLTDRMEGRAEWLKFELRFTEEQLAVMGEHVGAKQRSKAAAPAGGAV